MTAITIEQLMQQKYAQWQEQYSNSSSGYDYEKSFVEMWQSLGRAVLEASANSVAEKDRKKNFKQ